METDDLLKERPRRLRVETDDPLKAGQKSGRHRRVCSVSHQNVICHVMPTTVSPIRPPPLLPHTPSPSPQQGPSYGHCLAVSVYRRRLAFSHAGLIGGGRGHGRR